MKKVTISELRRIIRQVIRENDETLSNLDDGDDVKMKDVDEKVNALSRPDDIDNLGPMDVDEKINALSQIDDIDNLGPMDVDESEGAEGGMQELPGEPDDYDLGKHVEFMRRNRRYKMDNEENVPDEKIKIQLKAIKI